MIPTVGTKICAYFFSLIFPFITPLVIAEHFSLRDLAYVVFVVILEAYITHRMLKRPCTFVVPRMFAINFIAILAEGVVFVVLAFVFWIGMMSYCVATYPACSELPKNLKDFSPEQFESTIAYPLALLGLIGTIVLFYVRWKVFCKMFAWFDKSVSQVALRKTMLYVVGASYFFWIVVMCFERFFKITF